MKGGLSWSRWTGIIVKEFIQLKRDRITFATMIMIPLMQLFLFGFAINNNPKHLPTAVLMQEDSDLGRSILSALRNTSYFDIKCVSHNEAEVDHWMRSGQVLFVVEVPAGFARAVRRGDKPALLVAADATDPVAAGTALGACAVAWEARSSPQRSSGSRPPPEPATPRLPWPAAPRWCASGSSTMATAPRARP